MDSALTDRALAGADRPLNDEQDSAVRAVLSTSNGVSVIQALAGTDKTYRALSSSTRQAWRQPGAARGCIASSGYVHRSGRCQRVICSAWKTSTHARSHSPPSVRRSPSDGGSTAAASAPWTRARPKPGERAHLRGALQASARELNTVLTQRARLAQELGDPSEVAAERFGLG